MSKQQKKNDLIEFIDKEYTIDFDKLLEKLSQPIESEPTLPQYQPLNPTEQLFYSKIKLLFNNKKPVILTNLEKATYLICAIRSNEPTEKLQEIAQKFNLNLKEAIKTTKSKYQLK
ncbi:14314_t:CDS:1 [Racocetra persica]|uniref:14314_t:CDS:1 n=1 Tax=Racocetra persica TaxID=160502 RepID=A0ACA9LVB2_9GLOM|nr:14314_t:CDS:1 [Racocetra persica]